MKDDTYINGIRMMAKLYKKWILIGSSVVKISKAKLANRSILINPKGLIKAYYDKIHMYDVILSKKEKYFESKIFTSGFKDKLYKLPWGKLGMTICYDLRFPNLFRRLSKKGSILYLCLQHLPKQPEENIGNSAQSKSNRKFLLYICSSTRRHSL